MELKKINGVWVLHCIDYLTRFSAAHTVSSRDPDEIMEKFFVIRISMFGPPQNILSDNGGEFQGEKWESICETFNIIHRTTAAESPFSNGICERHDLLIAEMTEKVIEDVGCSLNIALMWAVHAKNSLINIYGFSRYQLVFGHNPNSPGNSHNKLPALSSETSSQIVAEHLNSLRFTRHANVKAESSDRIARVLRGKVYKGTHKRFCVGDTVYYKRLNKKTWQGLGKVIVQDRNHVLIKSGAGKLVKVHPCKMVLKYEAEENLVNNRRSNISKTEQTKKSEETSESESESEIQKEDDDCCFASEVGENNAVTSSMRLRNNEEESNSGLNSDIETCQQSKQKRRIRKKDSSNARRILRKGDRIFYNDEDDCIIASIISRRGKKGGEWENYWNVKNLRTDTEIGVNLDEVEWIKEDAFAQETNFLADQITWETMVQNYELNKSVEYLKAKENEVEKWKKFNVYEEVNRSSNIMQMGE